MKSLANWLKGSSQKTSSEEDIVDFKYKDLFSGKDYARKVYETMYRRNNETATATAERTVDTAKAEYLAAEHSIKMQEMLMQAQIEERRRALELEEKERLEAPQRAMDEFLGGAPYADVLDLVKEHYPEKFI